MGLLCVSLIALRVANNDIEVLDDIDVSNWRVCALESFLRAVVRWLKVRLLLFLSLIHI